ncbi:sterol desaturase family protein [Aliiroseovarius crassostreae]|uniref:sterol desaturase family protein n=1 Tax=Aliiroseovarius crassostreae TaxID=154981 RepID=UPI002206DAF5|nr:sterol desaturase family protein [Aliiroseovarius crassostreae]UWQ05184.1 sterol desaturase family protein [Aliiroseovarius crassostreae]
MEYEALIRLTAFLGLFALFTGIETLVPRRKRVQTRARRWTTNILIIVIDALTVRAMAVFLPLLAVGAALDAAANGWGLLNWLALPGGVSVLLAVLILDFAIWFQHMVFHKVPVLWRLHRVHHADRDIDVSTALRFHPVEIAASMVIKIGVVYLIGAPAWGVVLFEVILNGSAMFNHANMRLSLAVDRVVRWGLVTPDMHRVHHSVHRHEADSNYGFCLSIWDRIFGTYTDQPQDGHDKMTIGLEWQDDRPAQLGWSLMLPFRDK